MFTPCSLDGNTAIDLECHGLGNPGAPSLTGNYENERIWMAADSHSPTIAEATLSCPNCRTHFKLHMAPDTDTTPLIGGSTFKNTAPDPQRCPQYSNSLIDPIITLALGATMSTPPASIPPAAVMGGGGGYDQQGAFNRQQQQTVIQTDFCLQSAVAQPVPSMNTRGETSGIGSMLKYNNSSRRTSTANLNSPSSYCDPPSDHSSPNESNNKRKRSEDNDKPARYVPSRGNYTNSTTSRAPTFSHPITMPSLISAMVWANSGPGSLPRPPTSDTNVPSMNATRLSAPKKSVRGTKRSLGLTHNCTKKNISAKKNVVRSIENRLPARITSKGIIGLCMETILDLLPPFPFWHLGNPDLVASI